MKDIDIELIDATHRRDAYLVKGLLQKGADIKAVSSDGWAALHYAESNGRSEAAAVLREAEKRAEMASTMRELKNVLSRVERLTEMKEKRNRVK